MTCSLRDGARTWKLDREDPSAERIYTIVHRVRTDDTLDGPNQIMNCPGLPTVGSVWDFDNDYDPWAFCTPYMRVTPIQLKPGVPVTDYDVEQRFSTRPLFRCSDNEVEDPLLEPDRVGGDFVNFTTEAKYDKDGNLIKSSSHERLRGCEFDDNRPSFWVEQNVLDLELSNIAQAVNRVNSVTMWGLSPRMVKLRNVPWERKYYGQCSVYFTRRFEFDVNYDTFDKYFVDQGRRVLVGKWTGTADNPIWTLTGTPDPDNPAAFMRAPDFYGNPIDVLLDGAGKPFVYSGTTPEPGSIFVQYYKEWNFFGFGIPTGPGG